MSLLEVDGSTLDTCIGSRRSERFFCCDLLSGMVSDVIVTNEPTLELQFADGRSVVMPDTSDQQESFSVGSVIV